MLRVWSKALSGILERIEGFEGIVEGIVEGIEAAWEN